jgi:hypothetical protein
MQWFWQTLAVLLDWRDYTNSEGEWQPSTNFRNAPEKEHGFWEFKGHLVLMLSLLSQRFKVSPASSPLSLRD